MSVTGEGGKGSARRKGANDKAYADGYDAIFGKKLDCPKCGSEKVDSMWVASDNMTPEYEWAQCEDCSHEWNECSR